MTDADKQIIAEKLQALYSMEDEMSQIADEILEVSGRNPVGNNLEYAGEGIQALAGKLNCLSGSLREVAEA